MASPDTIIVNITVSALRSLEDNGTHVDTEPSMTAGDFCAGNFKRAVFCGVSSQSSHEFDAWEPQHWRWRIHGPEEARCFASCQSRPFEVDSRQFFLGLPIANCDQVGCFLVVFQDPIQPLEYIRMGMLASLYV